MLNRKRRRCFLVGSLLFWRLLVSAQQGSPQATTTSPSTASIKPTYSATTPINRPLSGRRTVSATETHFRIMAVVPLVGTGKKGDPIRPDFVPVHKPGDPYHSGIIAYTQIPTDDRKHAIVEMVATSPTAFAAIRADKRVDVVVVDHTTTAKKVVESTLQVYRKGFTLDNFPRAVAK